MHKNYIQYTRTAVSACADQALQLTFFGLKSQVFFRAPISLFSPRASSSESQLLLGAPVGFSSIIFQLRKPAVCASDQFFDTDFLA